MTEVYGSPYANNIRNMYNSEVVALAKNRFTDAETQLAAVRDEREKLAPSEDEPSVRTRWPWVEPACRSAAR